MTPDTISELMAGLQMTIWLTVTSLFFSLVLGTLIGILRVSPMPILRALAEGYIELFRNIPLLIVMFFVFNGLPFAGIRVDPPGPDFSNSAIVALSVYTAAYVAEVVRAGLEAISPGQIEAGRSLGMNYVKILRYILLPQAFRMIIPPLGNLAIALSKNTSVASAISVQELLLKAQIVESRTFANNIILFAGLIYLVLTIPLSALVNAIERRLVIQH
jgi:putative glutamine transport system permease protein